MAVLSLAAMALAYAETKPVNDASPDQVSEIPAVEDLMREHGVLRRILLSDEKMIERIHAGKRFPREDLQKSAGIVRRFIEDYHEKLEEEYLFPKLEKDSRYAELVKSLRAQHQAGRQLTDRILLYAVSAHLNNFGKDQNNLAACLQAFIRMYRPHAAREDTVLFPALHDLVTPAELAEMSDRFEEREQALFGADGFKKIVDEVAELERSLDIYELDQFTPQTEDLEQS